MTTCCRLCLGNSPDMLPLFETLIGEKLLTEIILSTLGVQFDTSLNLPRQVCQDCYRNVNFLNEFCKKLIENQSLLKQWKGEGKVIEPIDQILFDEIKSIDMAGNNSETSTKHDENIDFTQEQIEHEPISIKQEADEIDDVETTHSFDKDNVKPSRSKRKKKSQKLEPTVPKCYVCGTIFENEDDLNGHLDSHENKLPYNCLQCTTPTNPIILSTVVLLNKHLATHGFDLTCQMCPLRFRTKYSQYYHVRTAHPSQSSEYRCETCGKEFTNNIVFGKHVRAHKLVIAQRYKCEVCQKLLQSQNCLRRHEITHTKRKGRYVCKWCDETFFTAVSCLKHVERCKSKKDD